MSTEAVTTGTRRAGTTTTGTLADGMYSPPARMPGPAVLVPLGAALVVLTALAAWAPATSGAAVPLYFDLLAGVVALVCLTMMTTRPVLAGVLLGLIAAVSPAATPSATAGTLVAARWFPLRTALPVALASVLGHAVQGLWRDPGLPYGWYLLCVVAVHAALLGWGAYGRSRAAAVHLWWQRARAAEAEQAARVDEARLAERNRIAREMHDSLAHRLSLLATTAGALEYRADLSPEQVAAAAGVVREGASAALADLRTVIGVLRDAPDELAPMPTAGDVGRLVDQWRQAGMDVGLDSVALPPLSSGVGLAVYRVVQEGLTNAHRHAPGAPVGVRIERREDGAVVVVVTDTGAATGSGTNARTDAGTDTPGAGAGLLGLRERVELLGGALSTSRPSSGGFVVTAWLPA